MHYLWFSTIFECQIKYVAETQPDASCEDCISIICVRVFVSTLEKVSLGLVNQPFLCHSYVYDETFMNFCRRICDCLLILNWKIPTGKVKYGGV